MSKKENYITLGQFLKLNDYVQSGGEAKHRIHEFDIKINGEADYRRGRKIYPGDRVEVNGEIYDIEEEKE